MSNKYLEKVAEWEKEAGLKDAAKNIVKKYKTGKMTRLADKRMDAVKYHGDLKSMRTEWADSPNTSKKFRKQLVKSDEKSGKAFQKARAKHEAYKAKNPGIEGKRSVGDSTDAIYLRHKKPTLS